MEKVKLHTCGNATLILEVNGNPLIATDPWLDCHRAYFGSWSTTHKIPDMHLDMLERCRYYWISHYHPDHLNLRSLLKLKAKEKIILLAEQFSNRVAFDLRRIGFNVIELPSRKYITIDEGIKIATFPIINTIDSALLIKANNSLIVNLNDTLPDPSMKFLQKEVSSVKNSLLLKLAGYGDADMINIFDSNGIFIEPAAAKKPAPGYLLTQNALKINATHAMHFSSFHKYVREDSIWANKYVTPENDLDRGWSNKIGYFKQFSSIELLNEGFKKLDIAYPLKNNLSTLPPKSFGDDWHSKPNTEEIKLISEYLKNVNYLQEKPNFQIDIEVGGTIISAQGISKDSFNKKRIRLQAPRKSLLRAIRENIFDDLLIGNFAKLILPVSFKGNYQGILKFPSKYIDNAKISSSTEMKIFNKAFRNSFDSNLIYINNRLRQNAREVLLSRLRGKTKILSILKSIYQKL